MARIAWIALGVAVAAVVWLATRKPSCDEYGCVVPVDEPAWNAQAARATFAQAHIDERLRRWDGQ